MQSQDAVGNGWGGALEGSAANQSRKRRGSQRARFWRAPQGLAQWYRGGTLLARVVERGDSPGPAVLGLAQKPLHIV